jgi:hypothetical protein
MLEALSVRFEQIEARSDDVFSTVNATWGETLGNLSLVRELQFASVLAKRP